jgi:5'-deoxynucleotidase YfbR-like HD superfamily hydrolase
VNNRITTFTGAVFSPLEPLPADIRALDIAHALSNLCRFVGHTSSFYSVAQHSVLVSRLCAPADALAGLLHDASEAYLADIPTPLKDVNGLHGYRDIEARVQAAIFERFGLSPDMPESVVQADYLMLLAEARDLMGDRIEVLRSSDPDVMAISIAPLAPPAAKTLFLERFLELYVQ